MIEYNRYYCGYPGCKQFLVDFEQPSEWVCEVLGWHKRQTKEGKSIILCEEHKAYWQSIE